MRPPYPLAVLAALTACGGSRAVPLRAIDSNATIAPAPALQSPPLPGAEGRVQVDVVDEAGAAFGPAPSHWFEPCHHAGSTNVGWALFVVDRRNELVVKLTESEGLSESLLACAKSVIEKLDSASLRQPRLGLYVRFD